MYQGIFYDSEFSDNSQDLHKTIVKTLKWSSRHEFGKLDVGLGFRKERRTKENKVERAI